MITPKHLRYEFVENISQISENTLFHWWYIDTENKLQGTRHKTFKDIDKFAFFRKDRFLRTKIWNDNSDELILDFDNEKLDDNIEDMRKTIQRFSQLELTKYETYLSGGKGGHIHLRFDYSKFREFDREEIRKAFFEALNLNVKIDLALFRTCQMIGLEGFNHRKTNNPKLRINILENSYEVLKDQLSFNYLKDEYINKIPHKLDQEIKLLLKNKNSSKNPSEELQYELNLDIIPNYDKDKFQWHIKRFEEVYQSLDDGKKRIFDSLTRFLISRTHDIEITKNVLIYFKQKYDVECQNIDERIKYSKIAYEKYHALFPYRDLLNKEEFYKGWPWAENCNEPLNIK